jgi:hypothetical protein
MARESSLRAGMTARLGVAQEHKRMSAEEWSSKVSFYEEAADDENAGPQLRTLFARKANWFRILARLRAACPQTDQRYGEASTAIDREALLFSPMRLAQARITQWRLSQLQRRG